MAGWSVVMPVKPLAEAKTRLTVAERGRLVLAMALDTACAARAAAGVSRVIVVSNDPTVRRAVEAQGCVCLPDEPASGLNPALRRGADWARAQAPGDGVAALTADLPALRGGQLAMALAVGATSRASVVADRHGAGTTLYAAGPTAEFEPAFGPDSFRRHVASGAVAVLAGAGELAGLRHDVDTLDDLRAALPLGLGPRTAALIERVVQG